MVSFGTDGWRGLYQQGITEHLFYRLGAAVGSYLGPGHTMLLVDDGRECNLSLMQYLAGGLNSKDNLAFSAGILPSGCGSYFAHSKGQVSMVASITASHNDARYCGIKFFNADGSKVSKQQETDILNNLPESSHTGSKGIVQTLSEHVEKTLIDKAQTLAQSINLKGKVLGLSCANGATSWIAEKCFAPTQASLAWFDAQPNGFNINPATTDYDVKCWLTLCFDGDGDRLQIIDSAGKQLSGDHLLYYLAKYDGGPEKHQGVVGTVLSNSGLQLGLEKLGIDFVRADVGEIPIVSELKKRGWKLGGEDTGHLLDLNYLSSSDGILNALQLLKVMAENDHDYPLADDLVLWSSSITNLQVDDPKELLSLHSIKDIEQSFQKQYQGQARLLLRASGTEPLLRVFVESQHLSTKQLADQVADQIAESISLATKASP